MKPLRAWMPVLAVVVALATGMIPYLILTATAVIPASLRDNPWPMQVAAAIATAAAIYIAVLAFREKRLRAVATVGAALATLGTVGFFLFLHVATSALPPAPKEIAIGTQAPDFTLPDEQGRPVALASFQGHPTLLVFYRGAW